MMVFSEAEVVDFVLNRIKEIYPNAHFEKLEEDRYRIWFTGTSPVSDNGEAEVYFGNVITNYNKTNDMNTLVDFVNAYSEILNTFSGKSNQHLINFDNIFPVLKANDFSERLNTKLDKDKQEAIILSDRISNDLKFLYGENHPTFVNYLYNPLPEGYNHDKVVEKAFSNLKRKGWMKEDEKTEINGISVYRFDSIAYPYQAQFFIKDWVYEYFKSPNLVFAFPTSSLTLVMAMAPEEALTNLPMIRPFLSIFQKMTNDAYDKNASALSRKIFGLHNGKVITLR